MVMHVTLRQLSAFVAVLETGSFSEASKGMHVSQAAISGLIKELENRVGARLVDRSSRRISSTAVGDAFEPMARRVLTTLEEALEGLTNIKELRRGLVRVAAPEPLSCTLMPDLIAMYSDSHPGVEVRFEDIPIEGVVENLQSGKIDIGFGIEGVLVEESVEMHVLWAEPLAIALRADDPLAEGESVSWKDIRDRTLVSYMPDLATNVLTHVPPRLHPRLVDRVHRVNTALAMLKVKKGLVICPEMAEPLVHGFGLKFLPLRQPEVHRNIAMFTRRQSLPSPAVQSFLDFTLAFAQTWATMSAQTRHMDGS